MRSITSHAVNQWRLRRRLALGVAGTVCLWAIIHTYLVKTRGPEAVFQRFISAIKQKDTDTVYALTAPLDKTNFGVTKDVVAKSLDTLLYKKASQVDASVFRAPGPIDFPPDWRIWTVSWLDAATGRALPTLNQTKQCLTSVSVVPTDEGWRVAFSDFVNSFFRQNVINPQPNISKPQEYALRLVRQLGVKDVYPEPKVYHFIYPRKEYPLIETLGMIGAIVLLMGIVWEVREKQRQSG